MQANVIIMQANILKNFKIFAKNKIKLYNIFIYGYNPTNAFDEN